MPLVIGLGIGMCEGAGAGAPTLGIDLSSGALPSSVTFTRASSAVYFNSAGLVVSALTNIPRFGYHPVTLAPLGLLVEGSRTNLLLRSRAIDDVAAWIPTSCTIVEDGEGLAQLDGAQNSLIFTPDVDRSDSDITQAFLNGTTANATFSVCARLQGTIGAVTHLTLYFDEGVGTNSASATFDLNSGTISTAAAVTGAWTTASASIEPLNSGWYRLHLRCVPAVTLPVQVKLLIPDMGDGVSGVLVDYSQFEVAAFASSFIDTAGAQVTRAGDLAIITGAPATSVINNVEGTLLAEYTHEGGDSTFTTGNRLAFSVDDNTANERHGIGNVASAAGGFTVDGGATQASVSVAGTVPISTIAKVAYAYKLNDMRGAKGGTLTAADAAGTMPTCTRFGIGSTSAAGGALYGHVKRIAYWNIRQLDARLQTLTT